MTASNILKGVITGASALAIAGAVLAQVQTGSPSSNGKAVTPPPSTGVTTDTSRLPTDCDRVAANAMQNQPPHDASLNPCNKSGATTMGATSSTTTTATAPSQPAAATTATASSDTSTATDTTSMQTSKKSTKVAKADRG